MKRLAPDRIEPNKHRNKINAKLMSHLFYLCSCFSDFITIPDRLENHNRAQLPAATNGNDSIKMT